jgi:hypothetical protein
MSTREQARVALVTKIEALKATWTAYPLLVEYDNRLTANAATQVNPYLRVSTTYMDGWQIDLAKNPKHRLLGVIVIEALVKEGAGQKLANDLLEHFYPSIHLTDQNPPLRTEAVKFKTAKVINGWVADAAIIPFWFDSMA